MPVGGPPLREAGAAAEAGEGSASYGPVRRVGVLGGAWITEHGGEREVRLRFLAESGLRLLMADVDPRGGETLHLYHPREGKTLHLIAPEGGGLVEKASLFFPPGRRWSVLLFGEGEEEEGPGLEPRGRAAVADQEGGGEAAGGRLLHPEGDLLLETRGGRVLRVIECQRPCPSPYLRGGRAGREEEKARKALGGDIPLLLSFFLALEEARGLTVPPPARAVRAALLELQRIRSHCSWLQVVAFLSGRFRLSRKLMEWGGEVGEAERRATGVRDAAEALVPGGVRAEMADGLVRRLWKEMESIARGWDGLCRSLASVSPPRWAERRLARLPREGWSRVHGSGEGVRCDPRWGCEAWVGPLARALGRKVDARAEEPVFPMPHGWSPRAAEERRGTLRWMVRVRAGEVSDSLAFLEALTENLPEGPWEASPGGRGSGRGFGRCEGPEGETCCHLVLERGRIVHAAFSLPREVNRSAAFCLEGAWLDEAVELLPLILPW